MIIGTTILTTIATKATTKTPLVKSIAFLGESDLADLGEPVVTFACEDSEPKLEKEVEECLDFMDECGRIDANSLEESDALFSAGVSGTPFVCASNSGFSSIYLDFSLSSLGHC